MLKLQYTVAYHAHICKGNRKTSIITPRTVSGQPEYGLETCRGQRHRRTVVHAARATSFLDHGKSSVHLWELPKIEECAPRLPLRGCVGGATFRQRKSGRLFSGFISGKFKSALVFLRVVLQTFRATRSSNNT